MCEAVNIETHVDTTLWLPLKMFIKGYQIV